MKYIKIFENYESAMVWSHSENIIPNVLLVDGELVYNFVIQK